MRLERRSFLQAALVLVLPLPACGGSDAGSSASSLSDDERALVDTYFADLESARKIARAWLGGSSAAAVRTAAAPVLALVDGGGSEDAALATYRDRVRADFTSGAVATVEGWTFALTELQLCAAALLG